MKRFGHILVALLIVQCVNCGAPGFRLKRNKRFLGNLWGTPTSTEQPLLNQLFDLQQQLLKNLGTFGPDYSELPAEYKALILQQNAESRKDVQPLKIVFKQPIRPQAKALSNPLMPQTAFMQQQQKPLVVMAQHPIKPPPFRQQFVPIVPQTQVLPKTQVGPQRPIRMQPMSVIHPPKPATQPTVKSPELPDLYKQNKFVGGAQMPVIKPIIYNQQQQLPIQKKAFSLGPKEEILTNDISNFYKTAEFSNFMKEFGIQANIKSLPAIEDVMSILGTTTAEDTMSTIRDLAVTQEGMDLIRGYLEYNHQPSDGDYDGVEVEYDDEDDRDGEIVVSADESQKYPGAVQVAQSTDDYKSLIKQQEEIKAPVHETDSIPSADLGFFDQPFTYLTHKKNKKKKWLKKPLAWLPSIDVLSKDREIVQTVIPQQESLWQRLRQWANFFVPTVNEETSISPPINPDVDQFFAFASNPILRDSNMLSNPHHFSYFVPANLANPQAQPAENVVRENIVRYNIPTLPTTIPTTALPSTLPPTRFLKPIVVQNEVTTVKESSPQGSIIIGSVEHVANDLVGDLRNSQNLRDDKRLNSGSPSGPQIPFRQQPSGAYNVNINYGGAQKRNFEVASKPQRITAYDFTATGTIHKANPEAIKKVTETSEILGRLEEAVEKTVVSKVTKLTEQHQTEQKQLKEKDLE